MEGREKERKLFRKIVITGGPCAGKTTGLTWIQHNFEKLGYLILFVSEPATEMKTSGITPGRCSSPMAYQRFQMKLQFEKEKIFERAAVDIATAHVGESAGGTDLMGNVENSSSKSDTAGGTSVPENDGNSSSKSDADSLSDSPSNSESDSLSERSSLRKVLIVCDRGFLDNRVYMTGEEFEQVLSELGTTEDELLRSYDGIFHLETAARNAAAFYGNDTNSIRDETPEEARALDDHLLTVWAKHPKHYVIQNIDSFEDKMRYLIVKIAECLGEQSPRECLHRYLIDYPDVEALKKMAGGQLIEKELTQVYLHSAEDEELRLRKQRTGTDCTYYMTRKRFENGKRYLVSERRLSPDEYGEYLRSADPKKGVINKKRLSLTWKGQRYEVDLYPFWKDRAVLVVSLFDEDRKVEIPPVLRVRKEMTNNENYEISSIFAKLKSGQ